MATKVKAPATPTVVRAKRLGWDEELFPEEELDLDSYDRGGDDDLEGELQVVTPQAVPGYYTPAPGEEIYLVGGQLADPATIEPLGGGDELVDNAGRRYVRDNKGRFARVQKIADPWVDEMKKHGATKDELSQLYKLQKQRAAANKRLKGGDETARGEVDRVKKQLDDLRRSVRERGTGGETKPLPPKLKPTPPKPPDPQPQRKPSTREETSHRQAFGTALGRSSSPFAQDAIQHVKAKMAEHDAPLEATRLKVVALHEEKTRLEAERKRFSDEARNPPPGRTTKQALDDYDRADREILKLERAAVDQALGLVREHSAAAGPVIGGPGDELKIGGVIKKPWLDNNRAIATLTAEQKLTGMITTTLQPQVDNTTVRQIPAGRLERDYFKGRRHGANDDGVYLRKDTKPETVVHELGHALEGDLGVHRAAVGFLEMRCGTEQVGPIKGVGFGEKGRKDKFDAAWGLSVHEGRYVGKHYPSPDTEVISMGLEMLVKNPVHFAEKDPDYFKFMLGIVSGRLI